MQRDETMFQRRLEEIKQMPPDQQEEALIQLSLDYPGRLEDLAQQQKFAQELATQGMPQGQIAGSASNPFSVYVAPNALQYGAAGVEKYMGHKQNRELQQQMGQMRGQGEAQNKALLQAGLNQQKLQSQALRQGILSPDKQAEWLKEQERLRQLGLL